MTIDSDFDHATAEKLKAELRRFAGKCRYDERKKRVVYNSDQDAMQAYMALQLEQLDDLHKRLPSHLQHAKPETIKEWIARHSTHFARFWRHTHLFIPRA